VLQTSIIRFGQGVRIALWIAQFVGGDVLLCKRCNVRRDTILAQVNDDSAILPDVVMVVVVIVSVVDK